MVPPGMPKRYSTPSASNALRTTIAPVIFSLAMAPPLTPRLLELRDLLVLRQEEAELVDAVHEAVLREAVDRERRGAPVRQRDRLRAEVDAYARAGRGEELRHRGGLEHDRDEAVLEGVVAEDVGDARRHHRLEPVVDEGPRRVLAGRAAAEVVAGDEDAGALRLRAVQDEV